MNDSTHRLRLLSERLSKYLDRPIIDYWRRVQGVNVGFRGNPGEGIPIAGPPTLTGGAGAANPLLKPLLKKYKKGTFIGDAIRKRNFPLSAINFIEQIVGGSEEEIRKEFARVEAAIGPSGEERMKEIVTGVLGEPGTEKFDQFVDTFSDTVKEVLDRANDDLDRFNQDKPLSSEERASVLAGWLKQRLPAALGLEKDSKTVAGWWIPVDALIDQSFLEDPDKFDPSSEEDIRKMAADFHNYLTTGKASGAFRGLEKSAYESDPTGEEWPHIKRYGSYHKVGKLRLASLLAFAQSRVRLKSKKRWEVDDPRLASLDFDPFSKDIMFLTAEISQPEVDFSGQAYEEKAKKMRARKWLADNHFKAAKAMSKHFVSPSGSSSVMYDYLSSLGVAGTNGQFDEANKKTLSDIGLTEEEVKSFFRDMYLANQILMPEEDYTRVTRGMGIGLPGIDGMSSASDLFLEEIKEADVPVRISGQRAVSGFSEGDSSKFEGFSIVGLEVPREAVLSTYSGLRPQGLTYWDEEEALIIGAAEIAVPASKIKRV